MKYNVRLNQFKLNLKHKVEDEELLQYKVFIL